jgi:hypothetical protein
MTWFPLEHHVTRTLLEIAQNSMVVKMYYPKTTALRT